MLLMGKILMEEEYLGSDRIANATRGGRAQVGWMWEWIATHPGHVTSLDEDG